MDDCLMSNSAKFFCLIRNVLHQRSDLCGPFSVILWASILWCQSHSTGVRDMAFRAAANKRIVVIAYQNIYPTVAQYRTPLSLKKVSLYKNIAHVRMTWHYDLTILQPVTINVTSCTS